MRLTVIQNPTDYHILTGGNNVVSLMELYSNSADAGKTRAGKEHRTNTDRYFHVMGQGWYVLAREGISGPYLTRELAEEFVTDLIRSMRPIEAKEAWRYRPV